jgi:hypothetical protein
VGLKSVPFGHAHHDLKKGTAKQKNSVTTRVK